MIFSSLDAPPADPGAFSTLSCRLAYDEDGASTNYRTFQIRLVPPPGWQALAGEKTVSLAPGDARIVPFTVRVPEQASPDSIYDATFLLSDPGTGAVSGIAIRGVAVNGRHGIALLPSAEELEVRAGQRVDVSVLARNEGNQTEIISIDAESVPAWPVRVEPNEVTLAPGESRALFVHVDVPATARDGALHVLDLTASPRDADFASTRARVRTEVLESDRKEPRYRQLPVEAALSVGEIAPGEHRYGLRVLSSGEIGADAEVGLEADLVAGRRARGIDGWQSQSLRGRLTRGSWELTGGDFPVQTSDLAASGFSGRGVQLRAHGESNSLRLVRVRNRAEARIHTWGASAEQALPHRFRAGAEFLYREMEEVPYLDRESPRVGRDQVGTAALSWGSVRATHLSGEVAFSQRELPSSRLSGRAAQLAFGANARTAMLRGRFNLGSRDFVGRTGDRDGAVLFGAWSPGGRAIRLWSNLETTEGRAWATGDSTRTAVERMRAGVRWDTQRWPGLELSAGRLSEESVRGETVQGSERSDVMVSTSVTRGSALLVATLDHGQVRDDQTGATGSTRAIDVSAGGRVGNLRAALHWSQNTDWSPFARDVMKSRGWQTDLAYTAAQGACVAGVSISRRQQELGSSATTPKLFRVEPRLDLRVNRNWSLRIDASVDRLDDDARVNRWQISLHRSPIELLPMPWAPLRGGVRGIVFVDEDGDGQPGPGERRIDDVLIRADGRYQKTDRNGEFFWSSLDPGTYWLELDRGSLPAGFIVSIPLPLELVIDAGRDEEIWIPLSPSSSVRGRIFLDRDFDGVDDDEEEGVPDQRIALWKDDHAVAVAISDAHGVFLFRQVPAGRYELRIDPGWIPHDWEPTVPAPWIEVGEDGAAVPPYGIAPRRKPIIITYPGSRSEQR